MRLERWEEAEVAFKEAIRYDPEDFEALGFRGHLTKLLPRGRLERTLKRPLKPQNRGPKPKGRRD